VYIDTYIAILLWIFAIFGFIYFIVRLFSDLYRAYYKHGYFSVIITAKNQQNVIEGIVRGFMLKTEAEGNKDGLINIVLVDAGSSDDTSKIMKRLADEHCCVKFVRHGDLCSFLDHMIGGQK